ncbi:sensor histidine kinase [Nonomuraea glycinis]|uniref:sensor histidine kinase n=1 Tax=Nonomuraea glycinis TaxID=2047744 RepID=UPI00389A2036
MDSTVDRLRLASLVAGALLLAVLAVVGGVAIRAGLAPLRRVEETAAAIAAGDLTRRVPEPAAPGTEVGRLTRSLNGMLTQIEQGFATRQESEARMRRFVADVSHELRTPLFGIKGFSELYRMGGTDAEAALARIESESGRLARLVDDLLLLAALDEPEGVAAALEPTPMDLRTLAADAKHDFAALDPSRTVTLTGPDGGPAASAPVLGDEARLRQVVSNLVGNAVTHTPAGTPVRIGVGTVGAEAVLVIEDSGPGLSTEEAARAFDRFYRADTSRARATGGAGLGLAIVRSIVTAHGGHAEIHSAPGHGATFQILLPAVTP